jgi:hypothetical protein
MQGAAGAHAMVSLAPMASAPPAAVGCSATPWRSLRELGQARNRASRRNRAIPAATAAAPRSKCDQRCSKLLGGTFGETECDIDTKTGTPTGTVLVTVADTDPCPRPCVVVHEAVHEKHMRPVCRNLHACLKRGKTDAAQERCWETFHNWLASTAPATECAAYREEADCFRARRRKEACASDTARARLDGRLRGVECYRDCFCGGVAAGTKQSK